MADLGWDEQAKALKTISHVAMATNDTLYLKVLNQVLQVMEQVGGKNIFAWAITNILPEYYYHWDERYGRPGVNEIMEGFRQSVRGLIQRQNAEYHRLFLVRNTREIPKPEPLEFRDTESKKQKRIELPTLTDLYAMKDRILVLQTEQNAEAKPTDAPLDVADWRALLALQNHLPGMPSGKVYGIVDLAAVQAKQWTLGEEQLREIPLSVSGIGMRRFKLKPVSLLTHFEEQYHSPGGMFVLPVSNAGELAPLCGNVDWLIVGTKENGSRIPAIAISANLSLLSETMLMHICTDEGNLQIISNFWNGLEKKRWTLQKAIGEIDKLVTSSPQQQQPSPQQLQANKASATAVS